MTHRSVLLEITWDRERARGMQERPSQKGSVSLAEKLGCYSVCTGEGFSKGMTWLVLYLETIILPAGQRKYF